MTTTELPNFEIIVGTYEEFLLGYQVNSKNDESMEEKCELRQTFASHCHSSSIRCLSSCGRFLASGATDDRIIIHDMKTRKELCMLTHHEATITCLEVMPQESHVISGSADGTLAITRIANTQLEKLWGKPHKGAPLLALAVHPTGKLALTLGGDCTLRTWNLIKGRQAFAINLTTKSCDAKSLDTIIWGLDEQHFSLSGGLHLEIWSISSGGIERKFKFTSKITSVCWLTIKFIAVGHENGQITILDIEKDKQTEVKAHKMRVKCLKNLDNWLVSVSSDGSIKLWKFHARNITEKAYCNTDCRCTCLTLVPHFVEEELKDEKDETSTEKEIIPVRKQKSKVVIEFDDKPKKKNKAKKKKLSND